MTGNNKNEWKSWHSKFDSAWVRPNSGAVNCNREENCLKKAKQVKVLGICRGWEEVENFVGSQVPSCPEYRKVDVKNMTAEEWEIVDELKEVFHPIKEWIDYRIR